jgi:D-arabinose 1-dehydrogenase-like Zn-dependent alcohol dehydrogenase
MRATILETTRQPLRIATLPDPSAGSGELLIRVEACGVCHADVSVADGDWPIGLPRVLGHEIVGTVAAVGPGVEGFAVGERVATGWQHGSCGQCRECRNGLPMLCTGGLTVTGSDVDGGFAELVLAEAAFTVAVPDGLDPAEAAPLTCVGVTAFAALRRAGALVGSHVGVLGLGGMGHLAIQFAAASGMEVLALSRDPAKESQARELGATDFAVFDRDHEPESAEGSLDLLLVTGIDTTTVGAALRLLRPEGRLVVLGFGEPFSVDPADLCNGAKTVMGSLVGTPDDLADTLAFAARHGIRARVETGALEQVNDALDRVRRGLVRYRAVLLP